MWLNRKLGYKCISDTTLAPTSVARLFVLPIWQHWLLLALAVANCCYLECVVISLASSLTLMNRVSPLMGQSILTLLASGLRKASTVFIHQLVMKL